MLEYKVRDAIRAWITRKVESGISQGALAARFGISRSNVNGVIKDREARTNTIMVRWLDSFLATEATMRASDLLAEVTGIARELELRQPIKLTGGGYVDPAMAAELVHPPEPPSDPAPPPPKRPSRRREPPR